MDKSYEPRTLEADLYRQWEEGNCFAVPSDGPPYCIQLPPPNVTGTLHMGHAFQHTLMDALIRQQRMRGAATLWQGGTDHAGIATQMVVERRLAAAGQTRHALGREAFLQAVWDWKQQSGGHISRQMRRLGNAIDWSRERFTMDAGLSAAVTEVFVRLHEEGLIYRGKRLVNWDPVLRTAVSDLEVLAEEEAGQLWHFRYPLSDGSGQAVVVATTRPETLLGDTAVAVHPDDARYQHLIGQWVDLPLTGRRIPIIADAYVDPAFGTGCVKITPAHDFNDYQVGLRHQLDCINVLTVDACLNDQVPAAYRGLDRFVARARIVRDLQDLGLVERIDAHRLVVPRGDRSGAVLEPYLTDQWFVRVAPLAEPAIRAVEEGRIRFVPGNWAKTYFDWMHHLQDWCISRQIWWGHRIPAWYDDQGQVYVARNEAEVRARYALSPEHPLRQDDDVLDTWFSSALWPFSTLGWPESTEDLRRFYPSQVLVTGFDIIFFWVARMIMLGLKFLGEVPFREVYITGLIRDAEGQKMSKSKGNVLDPIDLIDGIEREALVEKRITGLMQPEMATRIAQATRRQFPQGIPAFGTDALRFTLAALATTGRDIKFDLGRIEGYRNFCNKLWNAARYVLLKAEEAPVTGDAPDTGAVQARQPTGGVDDQPPPVQLLRGQNSLPDRWICDRLQATALAVQGHFDTYRFDLAAQALYEFTWHDFCDWYLEFTKPLLSDLARPPASREATRQTLILVLEGLLRLLHPIMPFITEAIWQELRPHARVSGRFLLERPWVAADEFAADPATHADIAWVQGFITGIRKIRAEMDLPPGKPLPLLLQNATAQDRAAYAEHEKLLAFLARPASVTWLGAEEEAPEAAIARVGELRILIPLAGLIDTAAEIARLDKEIAKLEKALEQCTTRLEDERFVARAPDAVVAKERERQQELRSARTDLLAQRTRIQGLPASA